MPSKKNAIWEAYFNIYIYIKFMVNLIKKLAVKLKFKDTECLKLKIYWTIWNEFPTGI